MSERPGLAISRFFTTDGDDGFQEVTWKSVDAVIQGADGPVFEQKGIEAPASWSQTAINIAAQKYFRGILGTSQRESSIRMLITRVADTITQWGRAGGYFASDDDARVFQAELRHLLIHQKMAFNSPVWFNVGVEDEPQCSACFINSVEDHMDSILKLAHTEGMLFKYGSGTGSNLSAIRGSNEYLEGGGTASGPVSFMRGFDAFAGVIKSGGKTRRAAKMVILNIDHPDIEEFIWCKAAEEKKAWALIDAGYDGSFDGEAYKSISFQNANNSVRVTDEFMRAVHDDKEWTLRSVRDGKPVRTSKARKLWEAIAQAAWECGDPGVQFDTVINEWHTSKAAGRINASNPCSEYMYLDDSACNLASLNLRKFYNEEKQVFSTPNFKQAIFLTTLAQEIIVGNSRYPTPAIAKNSHDYRPLGLGYANLGSLLMATGVPYDSREGRHICRVVTSILTSHAYWTSAVIARDVTGPFSGYVDTQPSFLDVMDRHYANSVDPTKEEHVQGFPSMGDDSWEAAIHQGKLHGFRNGQATVLAPTGTIGLMMDCDTTGIEPELALVKYKRLVGGGTFKMVNDTVKTGLRALGYSASQIDAIHAHVESTGNIETAPHLKPEHLPVFDCSFQPAEGKRSLSADAHLQMMAAAQPFLSGAISKTVNLPSSATVDDVRRAYETAWELGLKAVAVYRDGCKRTQPLSTNSVDPGTQAVAPASVPTPAPVPPAAPARRRMEDERPAITHKFEVGGHKGYLTVGLYPDGAPGELFITMAKEGSTISGLMDAFATAISLALQHGVPLELLRAKFVSTRFEPYGMTINPVIPRTSSLLDYIFRWLEDKFGEKQLDLPIPDAPAALPALQKVAPAFSDGPPCSDCGTIMVPNGSCHRCPNCGTTSGCS